MLLAPPLIDWLLRSTAFTVRTYRQPGIGRSAQPSDDPTCGRQSSGPLSGASRPSRSVFCTPSSQSNPGDGPVAAAMGAFTNEDREEQRVETLARDTFEGHWDANETTWRNLMRLLLIAQGTTAAELAKVWQAVISPASKIRTDNAPVPCQNSIA
jgi:hypothetical protein